MVSSSLSLEDIAHLRQFDVLLQTLLYSGHNLRFLVHCVMEYFTLILYTQERSVGMQSAVVAWPAIAVHVNFAITSLCLVVRERRRNRASLESTSCRGKSKANCCSSMNPHTDSSNDISRGKRV